VSEPRDPNEALADLAHELKTPLAVISGFAELLAVRSDDRTRLKASAQIAEAADRLSAAVDDLLAGVGVEAGDLAARLLIALEAGRARREIAG
jgi:signal transduction histidine kinase